MARGGQLFRLAGRIEVLASIGGPDRLFVKRNIFVNHHIIYSDFHIDNTAETSLVLMRFKETVKAYCKAENREVLFIFF